MRVFVLTLEEAGMTSVEGVFDTEEAAMEAVALSDPDGSFTDAADPDAWDLDAWHGQDVLRFSSGLAGPGVVWRVGSHAVEGWHDVRTTYGLTLTDVVPGRPEDDRD